MLEFQLTTGQPLRRPHQCVVCSGNLEVMCDTHREWPQFGEVYVCQSCATLVARAFGLVKGKRMTELTQASREIEQRDDDLREALGLAAEFEAKAAEMTKLAEGLTDELELSRGRVAQLEGRFAEHAREALELAGITDVGEEV